MSGLREQRAEKRGSSPRGNPEYSTNRIVGRSQSPFFLGAPLALGAFGWE